MERIITLTLNPVLDKNTTVNGIAPNAKLRCTSPVYYPGGGGINVSRALKKLGGSSYCIYLAGGPAGKHLQQLISENGISQKAIPIEGWTRENLSVTDTHTNLQYRFGVPGPFVQEKEWKEALKQVEDHLKEGDYLVASGKLPPGIPNDFYVSVARIAKEKNVRFILDTSREALVSSRKADIYLMKPNLGEFSALCGVSSISARELEVLAKKFVKENPCIVIAISLGQRGALVVGKNETHHISAPTVHQKSTIGAGDSMVAGMVYSLLKGKSLLEMAQYGVACGTAATMHSGTQLCMKEDADKLYAWISAQNDTN